MYDMFCRVCTDAVDASTKVQVQYNTLYRYSASCRNPSRSENFENDEWGVLGSALPMDRDGAHVDDIAA